MVRSKFSPVSSPLNTDSPKLVNSLIVFRLKLYEASQIVLLLQRHNYTLASGSQLGAQ